MRLVPTLALLAASTLAVAADSSHLVPLAPGVLLKPIATAGDAYSDGAAGTKTMVGIPDGLGAYDNGDGTFTLVMNQELGSTVGVARAHGAIGSFVSRWTINKSTLAVTKLEDLITSVRLYDYGTNTWSVTAGVAFSRFCSADLPVETAVYNAANGKGVPASTVRLFLNGEESADGRAMAHLSKAGSALDGQSIMLPHLGRLAFENILLNPKAQDTTVAMLMDDTNPGYVGLYVGTKGVLPGSPTAQDVIAAAGLTGGAYYHLKANGLSAEDRTTLVGAAKGISTTFTCALLGSDGNAATTAFDTRSEIAADAATKGTLFLRPEDGAWDPQNPSDFYFVTTDRIDDTKNGLNGTTTAGNLPAGGAAPAPQTGRSRLWRLRFTDLASPQSGGTITCLIDGSENPGPQMMDNLTIDRNGRLIIHEDPGNVAFGAKIWAYQIATGSLTPLAAFDPALTGALGRWSPALNGGLVAPASPFSKDEESSGIIDASDLLGSGWFLLASQMHSTTNVTSEVVEWGQLTALYAPVPAPGVTSSTLTSGLMASVGTTGAKGVLVRDGGWGSAIAAVPGTTDQFYLMSDRGPNIDGATSGTKNFPVKTFQPRIGKFRRESDGSMTLLATIGMKSSSGTALSGLPLPSGSAGFTNETAFEINADGTVGTTSLSDANGLDPEGLVALTDGTFWVSDEYGPFLLHLAADGTELERVSPAAANTAGHRLPAVLASRIPNRGMEGLCLTPDGTRLVGAMQNALINDTTESKAKKSPALRLVDITLADWSVKEYVVLLDESSGTASPATKFKVSEITAVSATSFLIIERDDNVPGAKRIYQVDISSATDIHDAANTSAGKLYGGLTVEAIAVDKTTSAAKTALNAAGITEATKTLVTDLATLLGAAYPHDKVEGLYLRGSTLWISNDDDFGVIDNGAGLLKQKTVSGTAGGSHNSVGMADFNQVVAIDLSKTGVTVSGTNHSPVLMLNSAASNLATTTAKGTAVTITVAGSDDETVASGLTASVALSSGTGVATAVLTGAAGSWSLVVTPLAEGTAVFTVSLSDGTTTVTRTATVTVTDAAPTLTLDSVAGNATKTLTTGSSTTIAVAASDTETAAGALVISLSQTTGSTIATGGLTGSAGAWTLLVDSLAVGSASFTVTVSDGARSTTRTVNVTVNAPATGGSSSGSSKDDSNGCGVGGGVALLFGALAFLGFRRRH